MSLLSEDKSPLELAGKEDSGTGLARRKDVLPSGLFLLPTTARPVFPGQIIPVLLSQDQWRDTIDAIQKDGHDVVGVVYTGKKSVEDLAWEDLDRMGTVCRVHKVQKHEDKIQLVLSGEKRFEIIDWVSKNLPYRVQVNYYSEVGQADSAEVKAYVTAIINTIKELLPLNPLYGEELKMFMQNFQPDDPFRLADFAATLTTADSEELQGVLETINIGTRLEKALILLKKELEVAKAQMEIREHVEKEIQSRQREVFLHEQLKFIQKELGIHKDDRTTEVEKFKQRIENLEMPNGAKARIDEEMEKLSVLEVGSPEYTVTRNYLDWLTSLPWNRFTKDNLSLEHAEQILNQDHEGLIEVKERILEFLGVGKLRGEVAGSILLFVGPPGVGKTSLGRSIARALDRKFYRFSLGGMRDEAEVKGHRRTYIGAMPGKFVQAIKETGSANPVIMLDEIDKIGVSFHGDPASALLEVLDPEQNSDFLDHYLDVRFDLSKVLFIATANQLDTIPSALLDRMEVIRLSGYLAKEKVAIAQHHLLPRLIDKVGLKPQQLNVDTDAILSVIEHHAREAGVRRLEKLLAKIVRKAVMRIVQNQGEVVEVKRSDIKDYLGPEVFHGEKLLREVGTVTGLAWTPLGGATLNVEATKIHSSNRGFKLTGQLGDVMKESAEIAYSFAVANAGRFGINPQYFEKATIHLHVPAGATPKDGPSAGITMASALFSLARNKTVKPLAMTGELTLTGQVLRVGGIKEKILAARRADIKEVILPEENRGDYEELPEDVVNGISVNFVSHFDEVYPCLFASEEKRLLAAG